MIKRKLIRITLSLFFTFAPVFFSSSARAVDTQQIVLVEPSHRDLSGKFLDDDLTLLLEPTGRLGLLVFGQRFQPRTWFIDAQLIDEVQAISVKNTVAQAWLKQLVLATASDSVVAIAYGHPSLTLSKSLAPSELNYYFKASAARLETFLNRQITVDPTLMWGAEKTTIPGESVHTYTLNRRKIAFMSTVIPASELDSVRVGLASLLAPGVSPDRQKLMRISANDSISKQLNKLRIVAGKYRLTSEKEKVPITLVNDFTLPITVKFLMSPINPRIQVNKVNKLTLPPKSKTQLSVPVTVVASGVSGILAWFVNSKGQSLNDPVYLELNVSVISPAVAWFTTGAAILLFLAAAIQSVRRVRRSRT